MFHDVQHVIKMYKALLSLVGIVLEGEPGLRLLNHPLPLHHDLVQKVTSSTQVKLACVELLTDLTYVV